jgi:PadR family transcriptional regulator, regulatory protein PadR
MRRRPQDADGDLLGGTLDMLILRTLSVGPLHGFGIALTIATRSDDVILVEEGSLYPALHRLEDRRWVSAAWGVTNNNRRARFYTLTAKGRRELTRESTRWTQLSAAVTRVMEPAS